MDPLRYQELYNTVFLKRSRELVRLWPVVNAAWRCSRALRRRLGERRDGVHGVAPQGGRCNFGWTSGLRGWAVFGLPQPSSVTELRIAVSPIAARNACQAIQPTTPRATSVGVISIPKRSGDSGAENVDISRGIGSDGRVLKQLRKHGRNLDTKHASMQMAAREAGQQPCQVERLISL